MSPAFEDLSGLVLGAYKLLRVLSRTQLGTTYLAHQATIERSVRLELLDSKLVGHPKVVDAFIGAARSAARLRDPAIAAIHDVCRTGSHVFYTYEHLPGGTLEELVDAEGPLDAESAIAILWQTARALIEAEKLGIAHTDLRPLRIGFSRDAQAKIIDFGTAALTRRLTSTSQLADSETLRWAAPELLRSRQAQPSADCYGLGICTWYALAGRPPFESDDARALFDERTSRDVPPIRELRPDLEPWVEKLLLALTSRDPGRRPQSASAIVAALQSRISETGEFDAARAGSPSPPELAATTSPRLSGTESEGSVRLKSGQGLKVALAIAITGLVLGTAGWLWSLRSPAPAVPDGPLADAGTPTEPDERAARSEGAQRRRPGGGSDAARIEGRTEETEHDGNRPPQDTDETSSASPESINDVAPLPTRRDTELALQAIDGVRSNLNAGLMSIEEAGLALDNIVRKYPGSEAIQGAARAARESMAGREKRGELARVIVDTVDPAVDASDWRRALEALDGFDAFEEGSADANLLEKQRETVLRRAEAHWRRAVAAARRSAASGAVEAAIAGLRDLLPKFPASYAARCDEEVAALRSIVGAIARREEVLEPARRSCAVHVAADRFDKALALVDSLSIPENAALQGEIDALRADVESARETWTRLTAAIDDAVRKKSFVGRLSPSLARLDQPVLHERHGLLSKKTAKTPTDPRVELVDGRNRVWTDALLDLEDAALLRLLAEAPARPSEGAETSHAGLRRSVDVDGLVALLRFRRGSARAYRMLKLRGAGSDSEGSTTSRLAELEEAGQRELDEVLPLLESAHESLHDAGKSADRDDWSHLLRQIERSVQNHSALPYWKAYRQRLLDLYERSLAAAYRRIGPEQLVQGKIRVRSSGQVTATWDFSNERHLEDFTVVSGKASRQGKSLRLQGECRLLRGDPFRDEIELTVQVAEYDARVPNLNIGVWTRQTDALMPISRRDWEKLRVEKQRTRREKPDDEKATADPGPSGRFLAFGIGYDPKLGYSGSSSSSSYVDTIGLLESARVVGLPAFVVLEGYHGYPLHRTPPDASLAVKAIWAESTLNKVRGKLTIQLAVNRQSFKWYSKSLALHTRAYKATPHFRRYMKEVETRGSVTFLTPGAPFRINSIKIESKIRPEWLGEEAVRLAAELFKVLEPPPPKPKQKTNRSSSSSSSKRKGKSS